MADFSPSFGSVGGNTRLPTVDEQQNGFPCGPADPDLFAGLFRRLEEEMQAVFNGAGIAGSDSDNTTLYRSILALIAAATGGSGDFVLMSQARARLPIFPDVQTTDGTIGVTTPATGQIRIPAGKVFLHRGIYPVSTSLLDIATGASKTYHLRWNPTDGFVLKDLADTGYNPSALLDANPLFDSTFDDMLIARITTNSSNVVTPLNLSNKIRLSSQSVWRGVIQDNLSWVTRAGTGLVLNWARTPILSSVALSGVRSNNSGPTGSPTGATAGTLRSLEVRIPAAGVTRYTLPDFEYNYEDDTRSDAMADVNVSALAV
jgi:hypothetical protein